VLLTAICNRADQGQAPLDAVPKCGSGQQRRAEPGQRNGDLGRLHHHGASIFTGALPLAKSAHRRAGSGPASSRIGRRYSDNHWRPACSSVMSSTCFAVNATRRDDRNPKEPKTLVKAATANASGIRQDRLIRCRPGGGLFGGGRPWAKTPSGQIPFWSGSNACLCPGRPTDLWSACRHGPVTITRDLN